MYAVLRAFDYYLSHGIETLPTQENKSPKSGVKWQNILSKDVFEGAVGIGLKCGKTSNGLECLDFDNHLGNARENIDDFMSDDLIHQMLLDGKMALAHTKSDGFHLVFRSEYYEGNQKLASQNRDGNVKCVIETRGEGGYFCAQPTPGYKWLNAIPKTGLIPLTQDERNLLITTAKSFNEVVKAEEISTTYSETEYGEKVGDRYNEDFESIIESESILKQYGWKIKGKLVVRPGKDFKDGISATFGKVAPNVLYVFTSNGSPFEQNKGYKPFQIKALLEFNGDFKECAKSLYERYGIEKKEVKKKDKQTPQQLSELIEPDDLDALLSSSIIDVTREVEKPPIALSIIQQSATQSIEIPIFSIGDFSVVAGKQKAKKTYLLSMIVSAVNQTGNIFQGKILSKLPSHQDKAVVFDTEQGEWYAQKTALRIYRQSNKNFDYFFFRNHDPYLRRKLIERYIQQNPNVGYVVIDGIVDLLYDFNNQEESAKLIQWIMSITAMYKVHITLIIHQNKADGNARGHLGTMLTQKAETVLEIEKDANNPQSSFIRPKDTRGKDFDEFLITIDGMGNPFFEDAETKKKIF